MKHLINRVLELDEESELPLGPIDTESDPELQSLLMSLQPKIRVFGCGGCGSNTLLQDWNMRTSSMTSMSEELQ